MKISLFYTRNILGISPLKPCQPLENSNLSSISRLDSQCFGGDRKKLLESIVLEEGNASYYVSDSKGLVGYVALRFMRPWLGLDP